MFDAWGGYACVQGNFFPVVNICIELPLDIAAVKFLDFKMYQNLFLKNNKTKKKQKTKNKKKKVVRGFQPGPMIMNQATKPLYYNN